MIRWVMGLQGGGGGVVRTAEFTRPVGGWGNPRSPLALPESRGAASTDARAYSVLLLPFVLLVVRGGRLKKHNGMILHPHFRRRGPFVSFRSAFGRTDGKPAFYRNFPFVIAGQITAGNRNRYKMPACLVGDSGRCSWP